MANRVACCAALLIMDMEVLKRLELELNWCTLDRWCCTEILQRASACAWNKALNRLAFYSAGDVQWRTFLTTQPGRCIWAGTVKSMRLHKEQSGGSGEGEPCVVQPRLGGCTGGRSHLSCWCRVSVLWTEPLARWLVRARRRSRRLLFRLPPLSHFSIFEKLTISGKRSKGSWKFASRDNSL